MNRTRRTERGHIYEKEELMIIEMRTYKTKPGRRSYFLEIFRSKSVPAHQEIGMKILGPFLSVEDADTFFFMRGFPDLASREPMKAKFYEGPLWKRELENVLMPMLEKYEVVVVDDPDALVRWQGKFREKPGSKPTGKSQAERLRTRSICASIPSNGTINGDFHSFGASIILESKLG